MKQWSHSSAEPLPSNRWAPHVSAFGFFAKWFQRFKTSSWPQVLHNVMAVCVMLWMRRLVVWCQKLPHKLSFPPISQPLEFRRLASLTNTSLPSVTPAKQFLKAQSIQFDLLIFNCVIWNFSTRSRMLLRHLHLQSLQKVTCLPLLSATHLTLTQLQLHALAGRNSLHLPFQRKEPFFLQKGAGYGSFRSGLEQLWANIVPTTSQTHSENVYIFTIYCRV